MLTDNFYLETEKEKIFMFPSTFIVGVPNNLNDNVCSITAPSFSFTNLYFKTTNLIKIPLTTLSIITF